MPENESDHSHIGPGLECRKFCIHPTICLLWCYGVALSVTPYHSPHKRTMTCRFWCSMPVKSKSKFIPVHFIKACYEVDVYLHSFLTPPLDGGEW